MYRRYHHELLTFGQLYAYSENFMLPLHDEVVHGKRSLLGKMPADFWQQCANLRLLLAYQTGTPGKKLCFMGSEFGQGREWSEKGELDWALLANPAHRGISNLVRDLNRLYRERPELHQLDFQPEGFQWIDCHDADHSVIAFVRRARNGDALIVVINFTPEPQFGYRIAAPAAISWREGKHRLGPLLRQQPRQRRPSRCDRRAAARLAREPGTHAAAPVEAEILDLAPGFVARFIRYAERMEEFGPDLGMPHTRAWVAACSNSGSRPPRELRADE